MPASPGGHLSLLSQQGPDDSRGHRANGGGNGSLGRRTGQCPRRAVGQLFELIRAQMEIMEENGELLRTLLIDRRLMKDSAGGSRARRLLKYKRRHEAGIRYLLEAGMRRKIFRSVDAARAAFYVNELTVSTAQKRLLGLTRFSLKVETEALFNSSVSCSEIMTVTMRAKGMAMKSRSVRLLFLPFILASYAIASPAEPAATAERFGEIPNPFRILADQWLDYPKASGRL